MSSERRREIRFCLAGEFDGFRFFDQNGEFQALPVDVSRKGLAILLPQDARNEPLREIQLSSETLEAEVTLQLRHWVQVQEQESEITLLRCGFELSEKDQSRGIDLLALIHSSKRLKVRICA